MRMLLRTFAGIILENRMLLLGTFAGILFWILRRSTRSDSTVSRPPLEIALGLTIVAAGLVFAALSLVAHPHLTAHMDFGRPNIFLNKDFISAIYFLVMLAGMAAEYMFGLRSFKQFAVVEFVRPFWVSLIVFSVPWSLVDKNALTFGSVLACYQNGFFWKKILERRRR